MFTASERLRYAYAFIRYDNKPLVLDFWQDDFILNSSRYIALLKSRQTGFSFIVALKGLIKAMDPQRTKYTKQFVSYNEEDAEEKIRYAREFYESIPKRYKKPLVHSNSTMLEFLDTGGHTTSRLISLPCRPPRGKNGDICLDEFAIYTQRQAREVYTAASFCTIRRGCIEVGSTPLGAIGKFYDICHNTKDYKGYVRYTVPWWYAKVLCKDVKGAIEAAPSMSTSERVAAYGTAKLQELYSNSTMDDFMQECECAFIDSNVSYIPLELIYANTPGRREREESEVRAYTDIEDLLLGYDESLYGRELYLGYDVARYRDASAFYIIAAVGGKKLSLARLEGRGKSFEWQKDLFIRLLESLPIVSSCMDSTGMGAPLYEELHNKWGDKVEGLTFTNSVKETLAIGVKRGLERGEYLLENNRDFHKELHSIKRTATIGGNFRYDSERNERGHADSFWAWALASYAMDSRLAGFYSQWKGGDTNKPLSVRDMLEHTLGAYSKT